MGNYSYRARNAEGKTVRGVTFAPNVHELLQSLRVQGLYCLSYREKAEDAGSASTFGGSSRMKLSELVVFCNQMATMLSAGLTVLAAIDILYTQEKNRRVSQIYLILYESIQKGDALSAAMRQTDFAFPEFLISMIEAGEQTGSLDSTMSRMSDYYDKEKKLKSKITNALTYPIFLAVLSVFVVVGLFVFILPGFFSLFEGVELPPLTRAMVAISNFILNDWAVLIFALLLLAAVFMLLLKVRAVRYALDTVALRLPVVGRVSRMVATAKFSQTLAAMYTSGIPMIESVESIAKVLGNRRIQKKFESVAQDIREGKSLSESVRETDVFEPMLYSMLYIGEETGSLDKILLRTSAYYSAEAENALQKMVALIEPITIVLLGGVILLILVSILPVIYSMYGNI